MKKYIAEFIGTFVLVFMCCGTAVLTGGFSGVAGVTGIALSFGLAIVAMAYSVGQISGCHINPAVSLAMLISRRMTFGDFIGYVVAQLAGGIAGAGLLKLVTDMTVFAGSGLGANGYGEQSATMISMVGALVVEVVLTFIFVLTILGVTAKEEYSRLAGLVIGLALTFVHLLGITVTGTSVNPARSIGPALFTGGAALSQLWVFIVGPLLGAVAAALVWTFLTWEKEQKASEEQEAVLTAPIVDFQDDDTDEPIDISQG